MQVTCSAPKETFLWCHQIMRIELTSENWPVQGWKKLAIFWSSKLCKICSIWSTVIKIIWYQNKQNFVHLSGNNSFLWYTWQHFHHDRIIMYNLFWTLNRSIFPQTLIRWVNNLVDIALQWQVRVQNCAELIFHFYILWCLVQGTSDMVYIFA